MDGDLRIKPILPSTDQTAKRKGNKEPDDGRSNISIDSADRDNRKNDRRDKKGKSKDKDKARSEEDQDGHIIDIVV